MTKKSVIILFVVVGVVAALGGWLSAEALATKIKHDRLADRLGEIQIAVERYAVDHGGSYPVTINEVLAAGTLDKIPENPYTHEAMPMLEPVDEPVPGGVVYVSWGSQVASGEDLALEQREQYVLAAYGKGTQKSMNPTDAIDPVKDKLDGIAWEKVAVQLSNK